MTSIDGVSRVIRLLHRHLGGATRTPPSAAGETAGTAAAPESDPRPTEARVRESIVARLKALNADDPDYPEQATETFVEGVLLSEFGQQMTNDPQFRQVIRAVAREMRTEPATATDLDELFRSLQSG